MPPSRGIRTESTIPLQLPRKRKPRLKLNRLRQTISSRRQRSPRYSSKPERKSTPSSFLRTRSLRSTSTRRTPPRPLPSMTNMAGTPGMPISLGTHHAGAILTTVPHSTGASHHGTTATGTLGTEDGVITICTVHGTGTILGSMIHGTGEASTADGTAVTMADGTADGHSDGTPDGMIHGTAQVTTAMADGMVDGIATVPQCSLQGTVS